jgi:hypothetical protein
MPDRFQEETPEEAAMLSRRRRELWAEPFFTTEPPCPECGHPLSACVCNKGSVPRFNFWLSPEAEKARAAEEMAQLEAQGQGQQPAAAPPPQYRPPEPRKRQRRPKVQEMPNPEPAQPQLWAGQGNGTYGPAPRPAIHASSRPGRVPYNVAFREIVRFVTAELRESGEQWSDQSRQDLVSTVIISASRQGLLDLWERP